MCPIKRNDPSDATATEKELEKESSGENKLSGEDFCISKA